MLTLSARVAELAARLPKDSHNSSKPRPRTDCRRNPSRCAKPVAASPAGRKDMMDRRWSRSPCPMWSCRHPLPEVCDQCGGTLALDQAVLADERRQVFDLPRTRYEVTEHRVFEVRCACGKWHCSQFPESVPNLVQYGPAIKAAAVYLTQYQLLPMERTTQLLADLYGLRLSPATVHTSITQAAEVLAPTVTRIAEAVKAAPVAHFDETGQRVGRPVALAACGGDRGAQLVRGARQTRPGGDGRLRHSARVQRRSCA